MWRWADWSDQLATVDTGIDLVAREAESGGLCAIQCKFYAEDKRIEKGDLDKFLSASGKVGFGSRIVVSTTDHWGANAEDAIRDQQIPVAPRRWMRATQCQRVLPDVAACHPRRATNGQQMGCASTVRDDPNQV